MAQLLSNSGFRIFAAAASAILGYGYYRFLTRQRDLSSLSFLPETLLACYSERYGDIDALKVGQLKNEWRNGIPPEKVLVRVHAASLNPVDSKRRRGMLSSSVVEKWPTIWCYDVSGVVVSVGADVTEFKMGDEVFGCTQDLIHGYQDGSLCEYACVYAKNLIKKPTQLTHIQAASLPICALTAMQALQSLNLKPNDQLLITGGSGGVGTMAIQIAKRVHGCLVTVTASAAKRDQCISLGADRVINYKQLKFDEILSNLDAALDCTGEVDRCQRVVKDRSRVAAIVCSSTDGRAPYQVLHPTPQMLALLVEYVNQGVLTPVVDAVFDLPHAKDAFRHFESGKAVGKVVIAVRA